VSNRILTMTTALPMIKRTWFGFAECVIKTNLFTTTLDRTTKRVGSRFSNRFSGQGSFEGIAQFAAVNLGDVAAVVYAAVIEELVAGVKKICLGRPGRSQLVGHLVSVIFKNGEGQVIFCSVVLDVGGRFSGVGVNAN